MNNEKKKKVALFRFGVIAPLVGAKNTEWGHREKLIREIISREWEIPYSGRSRISRSSLYLWLKKYEQSGESLEALMPKGRSDRGRPRKIDRETEMALANLKKEYRRISVPVLLKIARERRIIPANLRISNATIYRILGKHRIEEESPAKDRRRFEAELPNDLWQGDFSHGPKVILDGKEKKTYLMAFIDDHSRLITHAEFYFQENLGSFLDCLKKALARRGVPRKLFVDRGSAFKAHRAAYTLASLGTVLIHAKVRDAASKGKVERLFQTIKGQLFPLLPPVITIKELNELLHRWIDREYHTRKHSSTGESPLDRYVKGLHLVRNAPEDLDKYFRVMATRRVGKDRCVSFNNRVFEAPVSLIGKKIQLWYEEDRPEKPEAFYDETSYGIMALLDSHINCHLRRKNNTDAGEKDISEHEYVAVEEELQSGSLFGGGNRK